MINIEMKNYNTILTEKPQNIEKLINMTILQVNKSYLLIKEE